MIGFVGLGQMGKPMAVNLVRGGGDFMVCDVRAERFPELERLGAIATTEFARLGECEVVFLSLPGGEAVKDVLLGEKGFLRKPRAGQLVVDTSTIGYGTTMELARRLEAVGVRFLDAPVSGMESRAIEGTLTVMCGGDPADFARARPHLERFGKNILYMGGHGCGQLTKLINQLLFDVNAAALAEILPMAVKLGLDPAQVGEVVNSGTGRSYASEFFVPRVLKGWFGDGYPMKHAYKDLVSAAELSAQLTIPLPVLAAATATYQRALLEGHGDLDKGGMIRVFEDLLGVEFRNRKA